MRQARQRQSQVCGVHGRASSGFGQQVHLWALPNPDPGGMLISPGRRVFRRVTRCHRPWLVAGLRPPQQASEHSRAGAAWLPYSPSVEPVGGGLGAAGDPKMRRPSRPRPTVPLLGHQVGVGPRPYVCALTRQVWPVDQAISPSPRASRDVAGGKPLGRQLRSRAGHATSSPPPWWCRARTAPQFAMGSAPLAVSRAWAGQADPSDRDATWGSASSVGIGRRLAPAQATLLEPCRPAPLDARLEAQHPSFERH